ncbi:RNA polymerase subunit sigma-70 [Bailinhaonella thermotolerans]|uniref:RNA polymerase sigma factor n=1 Tax=Bailinhaonella thermotolerans TaxID=1070861 RepID=A0A3A4ABR6_9ACTN|nr:RNA polymerase subunit sigma-70 [Bailinhaonella thermotolerans]RJL22993.1 sigma-70 family RNA polymerase sigma factor [Bailinhaonella thermotolerans]
MSGGTGDAGEEIPPPEDEHAFGERIERHRRELRVHCYRMLGSFEEAEDLVQETFLRAWRARETFAGRSTFRAWLYRIATNACLDAAARRAPVLQPLPPGDASSPAEIPWLQPFPDRFLQGDPEEEPDAVVIAKETIELAFLAAIQHLPPRQRAVLILRDVLGQPAAEAAETLGMSVAGLKSALQRARATMRDHLPERRAEWGPSGDPTREEREVLDRYMRASEGADLDALAELLAEDARQTMPPEPAVFLGRDAVLAMWAPVLTGPDAWGDWRHLPTRANRQPAVAGYCRRRGQPSYEAVNLDVLRIEGGRVAEITTFGPHLFPAFGLPPRL